VPLTAWVAQNEALRAFLTESHSGVLYVGVAIALAALERDNEYPRAGKIFAQYILTPLARPRSTPGCLRWLGSVVRSSALSPVRPPGIATET
jgi:hypothetical protein